MFGDIKSNPMNLPIHSLGDVCTVERGGSPRPIDKFVTDSADGLNWIKIGDADGSRYISRTAEKIRPEGLKKSRWVVAGDLILSNSMSFGHPYILKIDGCIHDGWLVLHFDERLFDALFLQVYLELPSTYQQFSSMAAGGVVNNLNSELVRKLPVFVPDIIAQKQFAAFVRQTDKSKFAIQLTGSNLNLSSLIHRAFHCFPVARWEVYTVPKYRFDEIAINSTEKKKPVEEDKYTYLGLEHLDAGSLTVTRFGSNVAPIGEKLVMKRGDVLFGKRRAYQKKVAIAPFDGIFSAHGMVLRPKENVIDKDFFPLFISSDYFLDAAIKISVGSLSPTINWRDLKVLEFELPSLEEQRKLAKALWAVIRTIEAYKELLKKTDDLVKSQFIEMFGDVITNQKSLPTALIGDVAECYAGATPSTKVSAYWENATIPWMSSGEVHNGRITSTEKKISQAGYDSCSTKMVPANSVVIALAGQGKTRGTVAITEIDLCTNQSLCCIIPNSSIISDYLYYHLKLRYDEMRNLAGISEGRGGLNLKLIQGIRVLVPPQADQKSFITFVRQTDKSKYNGYRTIIGLIDLISFISNERSISQ